MVTMARAFPLQLVSSQPNREAPAGRIETVTPSKPKSTIAKEIRYLGVRLLAPLIIVAVFLLCLLPSIREELTEYGWPRGTFKWLAVRAAHLIMAFPGRI
jgi:hypothetical protein